MMELRFEIEGEVQLSRRLLIAADGVKDFGPVFPTIGSELVKTFDQNFAVAGAYFGGWAPRKRNYPWPILQKTGSMRRGFRKRETNNSVEIYNIVPHFPYHQSKLPRRSNLPRRVMMKLDKQRKEFIVKAFQAYIIEKTRN